VQSLIKIRLSAAGIEGANILPKHAKALEKPQHNKLAYQEDSLKGILKIDFQIFR